MAEEHVARLHALEVIGAVHLARCSAGDAGALLALPLPARPSDSPEFPTEAAAEAD